MQQLKRGAVVLVVFQGDYGKVRPAIVIQSDTSLEASASATVALITSDLQPDTTVRVDVAPTVENGLKKPSQIQADKLQTPRLEKIREVIGHLDKLTSQKLDVALALHLNLYAPAMPGDTP
ncbi:MAG: type II toxin-antitoxin system PemK/MazF family toxin [Pseudomonadota bacterium]